MDRRLNITMKLWDSIRRLDELQAAFLSVKLKKLDDINIIIKENLRQYILKKSRETLSNLLFKKIIMILTIFSISAILKETG